MTSQEHPTHNELERHYCSELRGDNSPVARSPVQKHLLSCRLCRLKLGAIRRFVEQLEAGRIRGCGPVRADHISAEEIERYHLGKVQEPELTLLEEHQLGCQECFDRMEATGRLSVLYREGHYDVPLENLSH